ncbi:putative signal transducing protein [Adhaeribacter soli]|uniref:DUF2007 domain-containing protein n=1 Tax=Adhaeribacter soli TaxID=2607655 RepID=A0A5N1IMS4_9BACT|nr:hypothetical protein [Adhaeribacter soli]KAA9325217.1 hypothetical protein F0P94_18510 [Adhaeribacter soli]
MEGKLISAANYLSYEEGLLLYNAFQDAGISAIVKNSGPPAIPFGEGQYFELLVSEEDFAAAEQITAKFQADVAAAKQHVRCPRCKSEAVFKAEKLPFWQKLYYAGTEVYKCESCGNKFSK